MWYFAKDGEAFGPVETEALNQRFSSGALGPNDFVWQPGMVTWAQASTIDELWSEPCAPPLLRGPETDEPSSHSDYSSFLLKVCGSVCVLLLLYSVHFLASRYLLEIDVGHQMKQADVFRHHPEKLSHRLN
jgi:GYF domain 2